MYTHLIFPVTTMPPEAFYQRKKMLFEWVQSLIYHAARIMRMEDIKPEKKLTKFYNNDFKGVEIMQEPGGLRKHYTMKFITKHRKN